MFLEKIEITGFKSFAQKTILTFDQGITAIVGPNGSGKSNIADAIRWTLGEQSMKALRSKKSEDVIFVGSDQKSQVSMAEVSLHLNNEDNQIPLEAAEVVITRRLFRNGDSEYLINKSRVRLSDILELLAKSGFGQKTYSVIGQGMIGAFINTTPQERKNMLDEAAGVHHYQLKRDQTIRKLQATKRNLMRVKDMLGEIEPRLNSLRRQAKKAEEKKNIILELKEKQNIWYSFLWSKTNLKLGKSKEEIVDFSKTITGLEEETERLRERLDSQEQGSENFCQCWLPVISHEIKQTTRWVVF